MYSYIFQLATTTIITGCAHVWINYTTIVNWCN